MKKNNYLIKFLKVIFWPILFGFSQVLIILLFTFVYNQKYNNLSDDEFNALLKTTEYTDGLNSYINSNLWLIVIITLIIFLPIFYFKYKRYNHNFKINKNMFYLIVPSISISLLLNVVIININNLLNINNSLNDVNMFLVLIFSSGIVGPILEEFLFRGIVFNKLKEFNSLDKSIILCTIIFALFHNSLSQMIYAFIMGCIFIKLYDKTNNLLYSIIFHVISNSIIVVCNNFLISLNGIYSVLFILLTAVVFVVSYKFMNKKV